MLGPSSRAIQYYFPLSVIGIPYTLIVDLARIQNSIERSEFYYILVTHYHSYTMELTHVSECTLAWSTQCRSVGSLVLDE